MEWKLPESKTKLAVYLGCGGYILMALADWMNGSLAAPAALYQIWQALVAGYGVVGVRGWFKK
jgi:hypothetical protein